MQGLKPILLVAIIAGAAFTLWIAPSCQDGKNATLGGSYLIKGCR